MKKSTKRQAITDVIEKVIDQQVATLSPEDYAAVLGALTCGLESRAEALKDEHDAAWFETHFMGWS